MPAYKAYEWERENWSEFQTVAIDPVEQKKYLKKLARHFKVSLPTLETYRTQSWYRGWYKRRWWGELIQLGSVTVLGTLIHEFAHHLTYCRWGSKHGHDKKFKRELKRCYTFAKRWLVKQEA